MSRLVFLIVFFVLFQDSNGWALAPESNWNHSAHTYAETVNTVLRYLQDHWQEPERKNRWRGYDEFDKLTFPLNYHRAAARPFPGSDFTSSAYLTYVSSQAGFPVLVIHKGVDHIEMDTAPLYQHLPEWDYPLISAHTLTDSNGNKLFLHVYPSPENLEKAAALNPQTYLLKSFGFKTGKIPQGWHVTFRAGTHQTIDDFNEAHLEQAVKKWIEGEYGENIPLSLYWEYTMSHDFSTVLRYPNVFHDYTHYIFFTSVVGKEGRKRFLALLLKHLPQFKKLLQDEIDDLKAEIDPFQDVKQAILVSEVFSRALSIFDAQYVVLKREKFNFDRVIWWEKKARLPADVVRFILALRLYEPRAIRIPAGEFDRIRKTSPAAISL